MTLRLGNNNFKNISKHSSRYTDLRDISDIDMLSLYAPTYFQSVLSKSKQHSRLKIHYDGIFEAYIEKLSEFRILCKYFNKRRGMSSISSNHFYHQRKILYALSKKDPNNLLAKGKHYHGIISRKI